MNEHADRRRLNQLLERRQVLLDRQEDLSAARQPLGDVLEEISRLERSAFPLLVQVLREHHDLRVRVALLADRRPDGDDVVRATVAPIPGVGIGKVTRTYVTQGAIKALLGEWVCASCGCTDERACNPPCSWVSPGLCSGCVNQPAANRG